MCKEEIILSAFAIQTVRKCITGEAGMMLENMKTISVIQKEHALLPEIERRETIFGRFIANFAKRLPESIRPVAFCSPASFRDPELVNIWHPYFSNYSVIFFLKDQIPFLLRAAFAGMIKFFMFSFGKTFFIPRKDASILGVAPTTICRQIEGGVETSYCNVEDKDKIAWLLAEEGGRDVNGYPVSRLTIMITFCKMIYYHVIASFSFRGGHKPVDWIAPSVITLWWIISLRWVHMWIWALKIRAILNEMKPEKVYSLHEMHPHARIAWYEAARQNIITSTVQHCTITRTKLFYFPTHDEICAGLKTPDEFAVFSHKDERLLRAFYPESTRFHLVCGPRFSRWKNMRIAPEKKKAEKAAVLFAGSLCWWDNEVILQGAKMILEAERSERPIIIRLHPDAQISRGWKKWLSSECTKGKFEISNKTLSEDIYRSSVVIGMNTTVLEEGALMGLAVVVIESREYISYATHIGTHILWDQLTCEIIDESIAFVQNNKDFLVKQAHVALGINLPVFSVIKN